MTLMLRQIAAAMAAAHSAPSDETLSRIAAYLSGNIPFSAVETILPRCGGVFVGSPDFFEQANIIVTSCGEDNSLMPLLGRYLTVIKKLSPALYARLLRHYSVALTEETVFLESGLGAREFLIYLFDGTVHSDTPNLLDRIYSDYPSEIDHFAKEGNGLDRLPVLAYLCGKKGEDIYISEKDSRSFFERMRNKGDNPEHSLGARLTGLVSFGLASAMRLWGTDTRERFRESLRFKLPDAALKLFDSCTVNAKTDERTRDRLSLSLPHLFQGYILANGCLPNLNTVARYACESDSTLFTDAFCGILKSYYLYETPRSETENSASEDEIMRRQISLLTTWYDKLGIPRACLCAWAASRLLAARTRKEMLFHSLFADTDILHAAFPFATANGQVEIENILIKYH